MSKIYANGQELSTKLLKGVETLAENVGATLGPKGRNVILQKKGERPVITKDGVTVAQFVELEDPVENLGAQVIKQAAQVTADEAGDGTTTATVLCKFDVASATPVPKLTAMPSKVNLSDSRAQIIERLLLKFHRNFAEWSEVRQKRLALFGSQHPSHRASTNQLARAQSNSCTRQLIREPR